MFLTFCQEKCIPKPDNPCNFIYRFFFLYTPSTREITTSFRILYTYIDVRIGLWIAERVYASASFWNTRLRICKRLLPYAWRRLWLFHLSPEANATRKCKRIFVLSAVYYIDVKMFGRRWCCNFCTKEVISRLWEKNTFRKVSFQSWEISRWQSRKMDIQSTTLILHFQPKIYKFCRLLLSSEIADLK